MKINLIYIFLQIFCLSIFVEAQEMDSLRKSRLQNEEWYKKITRNTLKKKSDAKKVGFALYHIKTKNENVPYLVYVPENYDNSKRTKTIIYLHGGVSNLEDFFEKESVVQKEPIFNIGKQLDAIVIYPFGKKSFGWFNQKAAFENIMDIINQAAKVYNIDKKNIVIGGMSQGGNAAFWFLKNKNKFFKGFFAISCDPSRIGISDSNKKLITINMKDDHIYKFEKVKSYYESNKNLNKNWKFIELEEGGHGFLYDPSGKYIPLIYNEIKSLFD